MALAKILAFSGSAREGSLNQQLVRIAAAEARAAGAEVTELNFRDLPLPLYDQDLEAREGLPDNVLKLKQLMKAHQGFLIACPEYNSSITPLLKNAIDWASRPEPGDPPLGLVCFRGKVTALLAASPGGLGGLRGLNHVRDILGNIGVLVLPDQLAVGNAYDAFENGKLKNESQQSTVTAIAKRLVEVVSKLN